VREVVVTQKREGQEGDVEAEVAGLLNTKSWRGRCRRCQVKANGVPTLTPLGGKQCLDMTRFDYPSFILALQKIKYFELIKRRIRRT